MKQGKTAVHSSLDSDVGVGVSRETNVDNFGTIRKWPADHVERRQVSELIPYARNSRTHSDQQVAQIAASIKEWGWTTPVLVDEQGQIIAGHGRILAARKLGLSDVPVMVARGWTEAQKKAYVLADNQLALNADWDMDLLKVEIGDLDAEGFDLDLIGFDDKFLADLFSNDEQEVGEQKGNLSDRFMLPPFTVLNAREGWWQNRKRAWLALGIQSELGRDIKPTNVAKNVPEYMAGRGNNAGGSIFDPVLCEIAYRWFCPVDGLVLDPFAGGSVRGIVAAKLGRQYIGHELRGEQVEANCIQANEICGNDAIVPVWITGDSRNIDKTCADVNADLIFTCPPYADLEVYSNDPKDLSTMAYNEFRIVYNEIIEKACLRLRQNRFAVCVVGEVRDKKGNYYDFVGDTVQAFRNAGLHYYNEAILITAVGSLPIRAGKQFSSSRKLGKTHQNILVFVKGDGKKAAEACGPIDVVDVEALMSQEES